MLLGTSEGRNLGLSQGQDDVLDGLFRLVGRVSVALAQENVRGGQRLRRKPKVRRDQSLS